MGFFLIPHLLIADTTPTHTHTHPTSTEWLSPTQVRNNGSQGECELQLFDTMLPPIFQSQYHEGEEMVGPEHPGTFTSEFGATSFPSFESIVGGLGLEEEGLWGLHSWPFLQRNHPADSIIASYFGMQERAAINTTGKVALRRQLYQSMLAQALNVKSVWCLRLLDRHGRLGMSRTHVCQTA
jgi:hypothetical protein